MCLNTETVLYKLFGLRSLTKNITQTTVVNILKICILNLTFCMLTSIRNVKFKMHVLSRSTRANFVTIFMRQFLFARVDEQN